MLHGLFDQRWLLREELVKQSAKRLADCILVLIFEEKIADG
jgi:hypothetical protein